MHHTLIEKHSIKNEIVFIVIQSVNDKISEMLVGFKENLNEDLVVFNDLNFEKKRHLPFLRYLKSQSNFPNSSTIESYFIVTMIDDISILSPCLESV